MSKPNVKMTLEGDKQLESALRQLPRRVLTKGTRQAVNAAAAPIVRKAKAWAPRDTRTLKKALKRKLKTYKGGAAAAIIGADRAVQGIDARGRKRVPANYIHLVEKGTAPHRIGNASHPGARPQAFLERAYAAGQHQAKSIAEAKLAEVVAKEAAKVAAGGRK